MSPRYINPVQWQQSIGYARQACARLFRDGGTPADALAAFGLPGAEADLRLEHRGRAHRPCAVRARPAQGRLTQSLSRKPPITLASGRNRGLIFLRAVGSDTRSKCIRPSDRDWPCVRLASHGLPGVRDKQALGTARP